MTAWAQRPRGGFGQRLLALSLGFLLLFVLYLVLLPGSARADTGELTIPAEAAGAVDSAALSGGQILGSGTGEGRAAPSPGGGSQQASTEQTATSTAAATENQPTNIVVSVRVDSPGDDGPIAQTNVVAVVADTSNGSSTAQSADDAGGQQAATGQTASSTTTATQNQPTNIVISVRINSPGNNGPISQTNAAVAISNAANTGATNQGASLGGAAGPGTDGTTGGADAGSQGDPRAAIGPPAQQQSQAPAAAPAVDTPSRLVDLPAPVGPATAKSATHPSRAPRPASASAPAATPRVNRDSSHAGTTQAGVAVGPSGQSSQPTATRPAALHADSRAKSARRQAALHSGGPARTGRGIRARAANLLGSLAPRRALPAGESSNDVSSAVLLTLIAVLGAGLIFAGSTYPPSGRRLLRKGRRLLDPRNWWGR